jgi:hypothetical protein
LPLPRWEEIALSDPVRGGCDPPHPASAPIAESAKV